MAEHDTPIRRGPEACAIWTPAALPLIDTRDDVGVNRRTT